MSRFKFFVGQSVRRIGQTDSHLVVTVDALLSPNWYELDSGKCFHEDHLEVAPSHLIFSERSCEYLNASVREHRWILRLANDAPLKSFGGFKTRELCEENFLEVTAAFACEADKLKTK